jgi:hypothetical protein
VNLRTAGETVTFRRGLAAASIENKQSDFRDTIVALRELFAAAQDSGIDPRDELKRVAAVSDEHPSRGGVGNMRDFLLSYTEPRSV